MLQIDVESNKLEFSGFKEYWEDAWHICADMTDFSRAEEHLGQNFGVLQDQFYRALQRSRQQIPGLNRAKPQLEQNSFWVRANVDSYSISWCVVCSEMYVL